MTKDTDQTLWQGLNSEARARLETRSYASPDFLTCLSQTGLGAGQVIEARGELSEGWIPGVEVFPRRVFRQKGRGYLSELARTSEGVLHELGLSPQQWASALMHRNTAKGFHIHPPHIPDDVDPEQWFQKLYGGDEGSFGERPYQLEQWDVMFFLMGICEIFLVDERAGMPRRTMRFTVAGDSRPGADNAAVVIPPGVAHALRSIGNEDLMMTYGTSTVFNPEWEGRIASGIESCSIPPDWQEYFER